MADPKSGAPAQAPADDNPMPDADAFAKALDGEASSDEESDATEPTDETTEEDAEATADETDSSEGEGDEEAEQDTDKSEGPDEDKPADDWTAIRKEFPKLTLNELRGLRDKAKNLESGYTKKYQDLKTMHKQVESRLAEVQQKYGALDGPAGDLAIQIAKSVGDDPTMEARLRKAFKEVTVTEDDVMNSHLNRQKAEAERRFKEQEAHLRRLEQQMQERHADELRARAEAIAAKYGLTQDEFVKDAWEARLQREWDLAKANDDLPDNPIEFIERVAKSMGDRIKKFRGSTLNQYKTKKKIAAKVTPVGNRGGSVPVTREQKEPATPEEQESFLVRQLNRFKGR